jgi:hypothetical protein
MGTALGPAHRLALCEALGDDLVDRALDECQIASKRDPLFAPNFDPLTAPECHGFEGFGLVMGIGLLERLERREGVARPEFQPLRQHVFYGDDGISCGF